MDFKKFKSGLVTMLENKEQQDDPTTDTLMYNSIAIECLLELLFKNKIVDEKQFEKLVGKRTNEKFKKMEQFVKKIMNDEELLKKFKEFNQVDYVG